MFLQRWALKTHWARCAAADSNQRRHGEACDLSCSACYTCTWTPASQRTGAQFHVIHTIVSPFHRANDVMWATFNYYLLCNCYFKYKTSVPETREGDLRSPRAVVMEKAQWYFASLCQGVCDINSLWFIKRTGHHQKHVVLQTSSNVQSTETGRKLDVDWF